jgi:mono/diheme cytochrome c family protein
VRLFVTLAAWAFAVTAAQCQHCAVFRGPIGYPSTYSVPYAEPVHHEDVKVKKVLVLEEKVVFPFAAAYELFTFVAAPTTPPPVLVAAPLPAQPAVAPAPCCPPLAQGISTGVETRLARIEAALTRLSPQTAPGEGGPPVASEGTEAVSYSPSPPPSVPSAPSSTRADLPAALGVLQRGQCAMCHTAPGRDGIDLLDAQGRFAPNVSWQEIYRSVRGDKMPKTPNKLSPGDKAILQAMATSESTARVP